ncbi:AAA family ATPase [Paenibacillus pini]|nr:AAA family ATPase [Paenibacillus pini]
MFINRLTLIGLKKNYSVTFKRGLNYISGPTSTGKSTIAELINYALGSEKHKDYIEVRQSCTDVELEIEIGSKIYKIIRPLFDFDRPVKLFHYKEDEQQFSKDFDLLPVESPANESSLSRFLLNELGFFDIKVVNQTFSFRDIYKFCYLKQTEIDSEDLMKEKNWGPSIKRKPTFEILFNIFDSLLSELKAKIKEQTELIADLEKRKQGVSEFLKNLKLLDLDNYLEKKKEFENRISEKKTALYKLKSDAKQNDVLPGGELEDSIFERRSDIEKYSKEISEHTQYVEKLFLLRNQYQSELGKIEFLLEGSVSLNRYDFEICPSCLNELYPHETGCELCGNNLRSLSEVEQKVYKSESTRLKLRFKKLSTFIDEQNEQIRKLQQKRNEAEIKLHDDEDTLNHLRMEYISPYLEEIEKLNLELGESRNQLKDLDRTLKVIQEFNAMLAKLDTENSLLEKLKKRAKEIEANDIDKDTIVDRVSEVYEGVLKEFDFPKLSNAYIGIKDYLPYVRGRKYDNIGSLGSVTMLTMAYYLSVLIVGIEDQNNHPGLLIIDTPRKNLGADPNQDEEQFKDEIIYNSIIRYFIQLDLDKGDQMQLIIINNGYPEFLSEKHVVAKFDGNGSKGIPYGLIDDLNEI